MLFRMRHISKIDFFAALIAFAAVLLFGILQGILLASLASVLILLGRASQPHVAFLGRIPGTTSYSDITRHPDNESLPYIFAFRPEASLLYINTDSILSTVLNRLDTAGDLNIRVVVCDLSASPYIDLAGSQMLHQLHSALVQRSISFRIVGAHGRLRDLLRADGVSDKVGGLDRRMTLDDLLNGAS